MGALVSIYAHVATSLIVDAQLTWWAIEDFAAFCFIAVVAPGFLKRDVLNSTSDANATTSIFFKPDESVLPGDVNFILDHEPSLVSWDHVAGELKFDWASDRLGQNSTLHYFFPRCKGFVDSQVVDNDGDKFALDYWTPNGTADVYVPSENFVKAKWIKEISEEDVWDCRDRYNELPPDVPRPTPKVLTPEQKLDVQKAKEMKLLRECDPETWEKAFTGELAIDEDSFQMDMPDCPDNVDINPFRREMQRNQQSIREKAGLPPAPDLGPLVPHPYVDDGDLYWRRSATVKSYFSVLPANDEAVPQYAAYGADVLIQSMYADDVTGKEQARILHSAMSSILATHHQQQKRSLVRRLLGRSTATADVVMDATVSAVIDAADLKEQKWLQMLAIGAVVRSVRESSQAGTAGKTELEAINKMFDRFSFD